MRLPEPGTMAQLHQAIADVHDRPLDRARAPWEAVLVTGLEGGRAAYLFKSHHVLGDGMAIVQLLELLHSHTREPTPRQVPQPPPRAKVTPYTLAGKRVAELAGVPVSLLRRLPRVQVRVLTNPVAAATDAVGYVRSFKRQSAPPDIPRSPLLRGKAGLGIRVLTVDVPLASLRAAGKAAGGTINDAYLAGVLGGLRRYHEHFGVEVSQIPITIPVSTRTTAKAAGGNQFSAARLVGPIGERDAARRMHELRGQVRRVRKESAIGWLDTASKLLDKLPSPALIELVYSGAAGADAQISSFPGVSWEAYVAGAKVTGIYVVGPRPGIAMMSTMLSYEGKACIGLNLDPDAFSDVDVLQTCLMEGFDEVFALIESRAETATPRRRGGGDS
jgi:WS/DGAT/MGAT family acyltransferase